MSIKFSQIDAALRSSIIGLYNQKDDQGKFLYNISDISKKTNVSGPVVSKVANDAGHRRQGLSKRKRTSRYESYFQSKENYREFLEAYAAQDLSGKYTYTVEALANIYNFTQGSSIVSKIAKDAGLSRVHKISIHKTNGGWPKIKAKNRLLASRLIFDLESIQSAHPGEWGFKLSMEGELQIVWTAKNFVYVEPAKKFLSEVREMEVE